VVAHLADHDHVGIGAQERAHGAANVKSILGCTCTCRSPAV
jgi:hypothetical protein